MGLTSDELSQSYESSGYTSVYLTTHPYRCSKFTLE